MAAAVFDAVGPSSAGASQASGTSLSWSHTCSSSANRLLCVGVAVGAAPDSMTASVTYNGVAMTSAAKVHSGGTTSGYVQFFYLLNPATGANTVAVTLTAAATISGGSVSYTGVDQTTPFGTFATNNDANSAGTAVSVGVASTTSGNPVIDAMANGSGVNATVGAGQTLRWQRATDNVTRAGGGAQSTETSAGGTTTMSYTLGAADHWAIVAAEIKGSTTAFSGSATAAMTLSASRTGGKNATASRTAAMTLGASATGIKGGIGARTATMALSATRTGTRTASGASTAAMALTATSTGQRINLGLAVMALSATLSGTTHTSATTRTAAMTLGATSTATRATATTRTAAMTLATARTGAKAQTGARTAAMTLTVTFTAAKNVPGARTAAMTLAASRVGTKNVPATRTAGMALTAAITATFHTGSNSRTAPMALTAAPTLPHSTRAGAPNAVAMLLTATVDVQRVITSISTQILIRPAPTTSYELVCVARVPQPSGPPVLFEVDPIDWTGLSYTDELSKASTLTAGCAVSGLTEAVLQRLRTLSELASELWLYRNGRLVFAGPWLGWQIQGETLTLNATGLLGYLRNMVVASDLVYAGVDQFSIATGLINQWQNLPYGNFGIDTSGVTLSGVTRDATYLQKELHNVGQRVEELGLRQNGFDVTVDPSSRKLQLDYPQRGVDRSTGEDAIVFDERNVTSPNVVCSAAPGDVASEGFGIGTGDTTLYSTESNLALRAQYGRSAVTATFDGVTEQATLDAHVQGLIDARGEALLIPGPDVRVTPDSDIGSYDVGDTVSYTLHSLLSVAGGFRLRKRMVTVSPTGQETVSVGFV